MSRKLPSQPIKKVSWEEFDIAAEKLADKVIQYMKDTRKDIVGIYPIPRGGYCLGVKLSHLLQNKTGKNFPICHQWQQDDILVVDEIVDNGMTMHWYTKGHKKNITTLAWHVRSKSPNRPDIYLDVIEGGEWIEYPWER